MARHQTTRGQNTKLSITQSFFELQTPDFAWKFVWTVQPTDKVQKYKRYKTEKYKNTETQKNAKNARNANMQKKCKTQKS